MGGNSDVYRSFTDPRHPHIPSIIAEKRPRLDFDVPGSSHDLSSYYARENERVFHRPMIDANSLGPSHDRYLHTTQLSLYGGGRSARPICGRLNGHIVDDPRVMSNFGFGGRGPQSSLPPDASTTLFVEGIPANCTHREVSHIFRPFVGYKEVRLISKESKNPGGNPFVLCFVDFVSPADASIALQALQGYIFDEDVRESFNLKLQFARHPGARSGGGQRSKR